MYNYEFLHICWLHENTKEFCVISQYYVCLGYKTVSVDRILKAVEKAQCIKGVLGLLNKKARELLNGSRLLTQQFHSTLYAFDG